MIEQNGLLNCISGLNCYVGLDHEMGHSDVFVEFVLASCHVFPSLRLPTGILFFLAKSLNFSCVKHTT